MIKRAALVKIDKELGYAYFCPNCKRFICTSGKCKCGTYIDLDLPAIPYKGKVKWK